MLNMAMPSLNKKLPRNVEPRQTRTVRVPLHLDEALLKRADKDDLTVNDTIANAIAAYVSLPPVALPRALREEQQELGLKEAG